MEIQKKSRYLPKKGDKKMCVNSRVMRNKRYEVTKKNGGNVPQCIDTRLLSIETKCGQCIECRKEKAGQWVTRLETEIGERQGLGMFVTLTFDEEHLKKLVEEFGDDAETVAQKAVRRMLERYRKKNKKSLTHWGVAELGHKNTQRVHVHAIIWADKKEEKEELRKTGSYDRNWQRENLPGNMRSYWQYGNVWIGDYCDERTASYIVKYLTKLDEAHPGFRPRILTSARMGESYIKKNWERHAFKGEETVTTMRRRNGTEHSLPKYYRTKRWTDEEREMLRLITIKKNEGYINGIKFLNWNSREVQEKRMQFIKEARKDLRNKRYGRKTYTTKFGQIIDHKQHYINVVSKLRNHDTDFIYTKNFAKRHAFRTRRNDHESIPGLSDNRYAGIGVVPAFQGINTALPSWRFRLRDASHDEATRDKKLYKARNIRPSNDNCREQDRASRFTTIMWATVKEHTPF